MHDSISQNHVGQQMGHVAQQVSMHDSMIHNQTGVVEGQMAKTTSEDDTYYHYNNMYYKIPESAIIMRNSQNEFTGYQNTAGETIMLNTMSGLNQSQFAALHIGKYEGVQAAMTSMHDSTIQNQVGQNMGHVAQQVSMHDSMIHNQTGVNTGHVAQQVSMHDSMIHNQTGVVEGQMAKTTREDDTFVHYGGHVF
jgi:hypothetical protein